MRALIIEDHKQLADNIKSHLLSENYQVDVAYEGIIGEEKAFVNGYDVILLDLNLPDKDGIEILKFLREEGIETPIVIITARDDLEERTLGLDAGADDYIGKPFQLKELSARIRAVTRRYYGRSNPIITIGSLSIDPASRQAKWDQKLIPLNVKEFDILEYLALRHPAVVSSEDIAEHIYDEDFDPFSSILRVHLTRLRKKLETTCGKDILANMRGKGYYLCVE